MQVDWIFQEMAVTLQTVQCCFPMLEFETIYPSEIYYTPSITHVYNIEHLKLLK